MLIGWGVAVGVGVTVGVDVDVGVVVAVLVAVGLGVADSTTPNSPVASISSLSVGSAVDGEEHAEVKTSRTNRISQ
jgi:hypothetical protein